jgi:hypothetical protein
VRVSAVVGDVGEIVGAERGTGLASLTADIAATRELLTLFSPVIDPVAPQLVAAPAATWTR